MASKIIVPEEVEQSWQQKCWGCHNMKCDNSIKDIQKCKRVSKMTLKEWRRAK